MRNFKINGFSLIEILIAIGLMAVLSAATISLIGPAPQRRSRDTKRWADLEKIATALELYRADNGTYVSGSNISSLNGTLTTTYIQSIPTDPRGNAYTYTSNGSTFSVCGTAFETSPTNGCSGTPPLTCCVTNP